VSRTARTWLVLALVAAVGLLGGSIAAVATSVGRSGTMFSGAGLSGNGQPVTTTAAAKARAQAFADRLGGLHAGEVMQFSNGYYSELLTADGDGATEVLVDPATGAVTLEYGPAMMWNTRYGMHATGSENTQVAAEQAVRDAQAWLDNEGDGLTAAEPVAFPGYYTLHAMKGGTVVGMMSVNAVTGAVWYHTWHGSFVAMIGE
jgi:hypothetical protein